MKKDGDKRAASSRRVTDPKSVKKIRADGTPVPTRSERLASKGLTPRRAHPAQESRLPEIGRASAHTEGMGDLPLISVLCALLAALLFACASVAQQRAASAVPEGEALVASLIRSPRWWAGLIGDGGGYVMQAVALSLGSVLVVQPLIVTSLLFALPLSAKFSGIRITRSAWSLAIMLAISLAIFLVVGDPTEGDSNAPWSDWAVPLTITVAVAVAATVGGLSKLDGGWRALLLALRRASSTASPSHSPSTSPTYSATASSG